MANIELIRLRDDGSVPNHPSYPLILYHGAFSEDGSPTTPDRVIRQFAENRWRGAWINGIFPFHHYHARSHEVLANLGPPVDVQFGGASGPVVTFMTGSAVAIPAGCGHCRLSDTAGLLIVGAYPRGQEDWDLKRADNAADYAVAKSEIARVAEPEADPVLGNGGGIVIHWR